MAVNTEEVEFSLFSRRAALMSATPLAESGGGWMRVRSAQRKGGHPAGSEGYDEAGEVWSSRDGGVKVLWKFTAVLRRTFDSAPRASADSQGGHFSPFSADVHTSAFSGLAP